MMHGQQNIKKKNRSQTVLTSSEDTARETRTVTGCVWTDRSAA